MIRQIRSIWQSKGRLRLLQDSQAKLRALFENAHDPVMLIQGKAFIDCNAATLKQLGYADKQEFLRLNLADISPPTQPDGMPSVEKIWKINAAVLASGYQRFDWVHLKKDGTPIPVEITLTPIHIKNDVIYHIVWRDISQRLAQERAVAAAHSQLQATLESVSWQAGHDALTGLPNRVLLTDRFARATSSTLRQQCLLAVCMLDLDGFKPVNDSYGHAMGDRLLQEVTERLKRCVRGEDTVARLGGDEFVLLLGDLKDISETELMLQRIQTEIAAPYFLAEEPIRISASIGVTVFPLDDADPDTLMRHADLAMFDAKQAGRNRYEMFDVAQDQQGQNFRQLAQRVQQGLDNGEMRLFYQPKVNLRTGQVVGWEALIRWQHPERGLLAPMEFLPLVEQSKLIVDIGDWVMHEALNQIALWSAAGHPWPVSVNIAPRHFQHPDFLARLKLILGQHPHVPPQLLELEIVESAALGDVLHVGQLIADCQRELGVRFALDDFGTGYSSLTYLKRLPVDTLKIDQSFVRGILLDQEDLALVKGVIGLASVFKRKVVAEGVESAAHGVLLMQLGCEVAQGYGIARPMPVAQVLPWSEQYRPDPSWAGVAAEHPTIS